MKYGNKRTWSALVGRMFDSKLEATRGEELHMLQLAGEIADLEYQVAYILSEKPSVRVVLDFRYRPTPTARSEIIEDAKGVLTEGARIKYAWLKQLHGIDVILWSG